MKKAYIKPSIYLVLMQDICEPGVGIASGDYDPNGEHSELSKEHQTIFDDFNEYDDAPNHKSLWDD